MNVAGVSIVAGAGIKLAQAKAAANQLRPLPPLKKKGAGTAVGKEAAEAVEENTGKTVGKEIAGESGGVVKEGVKGAGGAKPNTSAKTRLPRTNGKWSGEPGNGKWFSNKPEVSKVTGGKGVEFVNGKPNFSPWSKGKLKFKNGVLDGSSNDFNAVYDKIKQAKGFTSRNQAKTWLREKGLTPHHKSSTEIELIPADLHKNVPHIGSASELRGGN